MWSKPSKTSSAALSALLLLVTAGMAASPASGGFADGLVTDVLNQVWAPGNCTINGFVRDFTSQQPLVGATVLATASGVGSLVSRPLSINITDANGRYSVAARPGEYLLTVHASGTSPYRANTTVVVVPETCPAGGVVRNINLHVITSVPSVDLGVVKLQLTELTDDVTPPGTGASRPVGSGLRVALVPQANACPPTGAGSNLPSSSPALAAFSAVTDENGVATFRNLVRGAQYCAFYFETVTVGQNNNQLSYSTPTDHNAFPSKAVFVSLDSSETNPDLDNLLMKKRHVVTIRVTARDFQTNAVIGNAQITATHPAYCPNGLPSRTATPWGPYVCSGVTAANGQFDLKVPWDNANGGEDYSITVTHGFYVPKTITRNPGPGAFSTPDAPTVQLSRIPAAVLGTVANGTTPLAGATVSFQGFYTGESFTATTGADGRFMRGLHGDAYTVTVSHAATNLASTFCMSITGDRDYGTMNLAVGHARFNLTVRDRYHLTQTPVDGNAVVELTLPGGDQCIRNLNATGGTLSQRLSPASYTVAISHSSFQSTSFGITMAGANIQRLVLLNRLNQTISGVTQEWMGYHGTPEQQTAGGNTVNNPLNPPDDPISGVTVTCQAPNYQPVVATSTGTGTWTMNAPRANGYQCSASHPLFYPLSAPNAHTLPTQDPSTQGANQPFNLAGTPITGKTFMMERKDWVITGVARNQTSAPVAGAQVCARNPMISLVTPSACTTTDANGGYSLTVRYIPANTVVSPLFPLPVVGSPSGIGHRANPVLLVAAAPGHLDGSSIVLIGPEPSPTILWLTGDMTLVRLP
jgi:hypothetical protein